MRVLVVGGAGYIGSVTVQQLVAAGHEVTVLDDVSHGHRGAVDPDAALIVGSALDEAAVEQAFSPAPDAVIHFAGFIAVGESMQAPERFFRNNITSTINLVDAMVRHAVSRFVFSSTAAVFGDPAYVPIDEQHPLQPVNPYGESKLTVERMLRWMDERRGIRSVALRYFNASGAAGRLGEDHHPETHLIPIVLEVAEGKRPSLPLFGNDYPTRDGTCVRDYVHVLDLAQAHILALDYAARASGRFNLGSGQGSTNLEVVEACRRVTGHAIPVSIEPRRAGDPPELVASSALARADLGWRPEFEAIDAIVESAWRWRLDHPHGYADGDRQA